MELFYAESKTASGMCITDATAGNRFFFTHPEKHLWENATMEDWEYLDSTVNGELFKEFKLIPCQDGTPLTNIQIQTAQ